MVARLFAACTPLTNLQSQNSVVLKFQISIVLQSVRGVREEGSFMQDKEKRMLEKKIVQAVLASG
jgi:hypothetical protein